MGRVFSSSIFKKLKIAGGINSECTKHVMALYENVLEASVFSVFPVSSSKVAEITKIIGNRIYAILSWTRYR